MDTTNISNTPPGAVLVPVPTSGYPSGPPYADPGGLTLLLTRNHGGIVNSLGNYVIILENDDLLAGKIRYNILDGRPGIQDVPWHVAPHPVYDEDLAQIRLYIGSKYGISKRDEIKEAITIVAHRNKYHPVVDYLNALKWDGTPRIADLFPRYLGAEKCDITASITHLLLNACIERSFHPGCKYDTCVVLADSRQGTGKSTMCRLLALQDCWFTDCLSNLSNQKQAFEVIKGHLVVELSEMLATSRAKTIEDIKSYLSRTSETYRTPYDVYPQDYPRQCVFIGTSNKGDFLPNDRTGNRRFIPILLNGSQAECHPLENEAETREFVKQCYAEALEFGRRNGFSLILDKKFTSELIEIQESRTPEDTRVGMIQTWLDDTDENIVCSRMIWEGVFGDSYSQPSNKELSDISEIMNTQIDGWQRYQSGQSTGNRYTFKGNNKKYGQQRSWERITPKDSNKDGTDDGFFLWPKGVPDPV